MSGRLRPGGGRGLPTWQPAGDVAPERPGGTSGPLHAGLLARVPLHHLCPGEQQQTADLCAASSDPSQGTAPGAWSQQENDEEDQADANQVPTPPRTTPSP